MLTKIYPTFILFIISLFSNNYIKAQTDSLIQQQVIRSGKYATIAYTTNQGYVLTKKEIEQKLLSVNTSALELQKSKNWRTSEAVIAVATISTGIIELINLKNNPKANATPVASVMLGGLVMELVSGIQAGKHYRKAITTYNNHFQP
jgi:hypothetical protein